MAASPKFLASKLVRGLNYMYNCNLVLNVSHYHKNGRQVTLYTASECFVSEDDGFVSTVLYKSTSVFNMVTYLRDLLYRFRGEEIPLDNEYYMRSRNYSTGQAQMEYMVEKYGKQI